MKQNVFVLPTNGESRLIRLSIFGKDKLHLTKDILPIQDEEKYQHIYITNDEEIKEWFIVNGTNGYSQPMRYSKMFPKDKFPNGHNKDILKLLSIILTTDQDLIKDGVQSIDDNFLNWFVNNSSCEYVEVEKDEFYSKKAFIEGKDAITYKYKIIIPKETPKQETLEEAAKNTTKIYINEREKQTAFLEFINGANWMSKTLYSEEDLHSAFEAGMMFIGEDKGSFKEWFEQHKKK